MPDFKLVDVEGLRKELQSMSAHYEDMHEESRADDYDHALELIDAHTVEPEWKRLDEVTEWDDSTLVWTAYPTADIGGEYRGGPFWLHQIRRGKVERPIMVSKTHPRLAHPPPLPDSPEQEEG